jgi:hypothetical protein
MMADTEHFDRWPLPDSTVAIIVDEMIVNRENRRGECHEMSRQAV